MDYRGEDRGEDRGFRFSSHIFLGMLVIFLGVFFLLGNMGFIYVNRVWAYWPVIVIVFGIFKVITAHELPGRVGGSLLAVFGFLLLNNNLSYGYHLSIWRFWPLLLIWIGFNIAWQSFQNKKPDRDRVEDKSNTISRFGILGGVNESCYFKDFQGGELTAFMGGGEIDLRKSNIESGEAVLTVNVFMGGFKIFIPEDWTVTCKAFPFMGGIEDKTLPRQSDSEKYLIIKGFAVMGGVEIRN